MPAQTSAILLAAGLSRRMGQSKPLLPIGGRPAVVRCVEALLGAGVSEVVVVLGHMSEEVAAAIGNLPVRLVINRDPTSEMSDSVRLGLEALPPGEGNVLVALCDQPLVNAGTLQALAGHRFFPPFAIGIPVFAGQRGHPTLFSRPVLEEIRHRETLREVVRSNPARVELLLQEDPGVVLDMDTPEDYRALCLLWEARNPPPSTPGASPTSPTT